MSTVPRRQANKKATVSVKNKCTKKERKSTCCNTTVCERLIRTSEIYYRIYLLVLEVLARIDHHEGGDVHAGSDRESNHDDFHMAVQHSAKGIDEDRHNHDVKGVDEDCCIHLVKENDKANACVVYGDLLQLLVGHWEEGQE